MQKASNYAWKTGLHQYSKARRDSLAVKKCTTLLPPLPDRPDKKGDLWPQSSIRNLHFDRGRRVFILISLDEKAWGDDGNDATSGDHHVHMTDVQHEIDHFNQQERVGVANMSGSGSMQNCCAHFATHTNRSSRGSQRCPLLVTKMGDL